MKKSTNNAFDWRNQPKHVDFREKSRRQHLLDATRVNNYSDLCAFTAPEKQQKLKRGTI